MKHMLLAKGLFYLACIIGLAVFNCQPVPDSPVPAHWMRPCQPEVELVGDGLLYAHVADRPELLLRSRGGGVHLQSRPAYIVVVGALSVVVEQVYHLAGWDSTRMDGYVTEMVAFVLLNFALLLAAVLLFDRLLQPFRHFSWLVAVLGLFLIVNTVAIDYIWYVHVQMLIILCPLVLVACAYLILKYPVSFSRYLSPICLVLGVLPAFYGTFVLLLPVAVIAYLLAWWHHRADDTFQRSPIRMARDGALMMFCMALPYTGWVLTAYGLTGSYYNREIADFEQFIWVWNA